MIISLRLLVAHRSNKSAPHLVFLMYAASSVSAARKSLTCSQTVEIVCAADSTWRWTRRTSTALSWRLLTVAPALSSWCSVRRPFLDRLPLSVIGSCGTREEWSGHRLARHPSIHSFIHPLIHSSGRRNTGHKSRWPLMHMQGKCPCREKQLPCTHLGWCRP